MRRYPSHAVVFEVISHDEDGESSIPAGTHVEAAGPCCLETVQAWKCGVLVLNGQREEDEYQWATNLRPLTRAAREMLELCVKLSNNQKMS